MEFQSINLVMPNLPLTPPSGMINLRDRPRVLTDGIVLGVEVKEGIPRTEPLRVLPGAPPKGLRVANPIKIGMIRNLKPQALWPK